MKKIKGKKKSERLTIFLNVLLEIQCNAKVGSIRGWHVHIVSICYAPPARFWMWFLPVAAPICHINLGENCKSGTGQLFSLLILIVRAVWSLKALVLWMRRHATCTVLGCLHPALNEHQLAFRKLCTVTSRLLLTFRLVYIRLSLSSIVCCVIFRLSNPWVAYQLPFNVYFSYLGTYRKKNETA